MHSTERFRRYSDAVLLPEEVKQLSACKKLGAKPLSPDANREDPTFWYVNYFAIAHQVSDSVDDIALLIHRRKVCSQSAGNWTEHISHRARVARCSGCCQTARSTPNQECTSSRSKQLYQRTLKSISPLHSNQN